MSPYDCLGSGLIVCLFGLRMISLMVAVLVRGTESKTEREKRMAGLGGED